MVGSGIRGSVVVWPSGFIRLGRIHWYGDWWKAGLGDMLWSRRLIMLILLGVLL